MMLASTPELLDDVVNTPPYCRDNLTKVTLAGNLHLIPGHPGKLAASTGIRIWRSHGTRFEVPVQ